MAVKGLKTIEILINIKVNFKIKGKNQHDKNELPHRVDRLLTLLRGYFLPNRNLWRHYSTQCHVRACMCPPERGTNCIVLRM